MIKSLILFIKKFFFKKRNCIHCKYSCIKIKLSCKKYLKVYTFKNEVK